MNILLKNNNLFSDPYDSENDSEDYSSSNSEGSPSKAISFNIEGVCKSTGKPCLLCLKGEECKWIGRPGHLQFSEDEKQENEEISLASLKMSKEKNQKEVAGKKIEEKVSKEIEEKKKEISNIKIEGVCKTTGKPCSVCLEGKECKWIGFPGHVKRPENENIEQKQYLIEGVCNTTGKPCILCSEGKPCEWIGFPGHLKQNKSENQQIDYLKFIDGVCKSTGKPCQLCLNGRSCKWIGRLGHLRSNVKIN
jgi:hypothetical protein